MFQLANSFMKFLGWTFKDAQGNIVTADDPTWGWVVKITDAVQVILAPILAIVAAAGVIWAIVLGVQMARADSSDKRDEIKKRLIGLVVGIAILVVLIIFFTTLFPLIMDAFVINAGNTPAA